MNTEYFRALRNDCWTFMYINKYCIESCFYFLRAVSFRERYWPIKGNNVWDLLLLPGKSHGRRSLVGCSPWGPEESDTPERLPFHVSLSCTGEWNGNPLQCSCLENPRDGGAWWAAIYGVIQSWYDWSNLAAAAAAM